MTGSFQISRHQTNFLPFTFGLILLAASVFPATGNADELDLSVLISVTSENNIGFLRNNLRALYNALDSTILNTNNKQTKNKLDVEVILLEVNNLEPITKRFLRSDGIELVVDTWRQEGRRIRSISPGKDGWKFATAINEAVNLTTGRTILLLSEKTEVSVDFFSQVSAFFNDGDLSLRDDVGIIGAKLLKYDNTVHHCGIEFAMGKIPGRNPNWWNPDDQGNRKNCPMPYYPHQGRSVSDRRVSIEKNPTAVSQACMLLSRDSFSAVGGLNSSLSDLFAGVDLNLKVSQELGKSIIYSPRVTAVYFGDTEKWENEDEVKAFTLIWGKYLDEKITNAYLIKNFTLVWNMECGKGAVLGFTTEALGFISGLENKISLKVEVSNLNGCIDDMNAIGLPACTVSALRRLAELTVEKDSVLVVHRDPGRYNSFIDMGNDRQLYVIGRSMYETDRIPNTWVNNCNNLVDKIWVPSQFNVWSFNRSGVDIGQLEVMPEPVDAFTYDPTIVKPMTLQNKKEFNFLSVMKWEKRKGWDSLLSAYFREFSSEDSVTLHIRSNLDNKNVAEYEKFVENFLNETGRSEKELPTVSFIKEQMPYSKFPSLYKAVDCVVLATHGEGWGLPIVEGMSMGLPTIATNWSGSTEFMTEENSYLIPVEEFVEASVSGHFWAQPSVKAMQMAMRSVYENKDEAHQIGTKARADIKTKYSVEKLAEMVLDRIKWIEDSKEDLLALKTQHKEEMKQKKKEEEEKNKGKNRIKIVED